MVTCESILRLNNLEKMRLVAGKGGLNRIITWVHVVELPEVARWVKGGELLFITGVTIKDNIEALIKLVSDINKRNLSGLVINVGPYIKETPKEVKELANSIDFPIFEIPFETKLIDITQAICKEIFSSKLRFESINNFMKELIYGDIEVTDEIVNRATIYGYSVKKAYFSLLVDINDFPGYIKKNSIKDEEVIIDIKNQMEQIVEHLMYRYNKKYLYMKHSDSFLLMVPVEKNLKELNYIKIIAEDIKRDIEEKINGLEVSIGIGGICRELKDFKKNVLRAQKSVEVSKKCGIGNGIINYKELGIYRLFFDMKKRDEMKNLYYETLETLRLYDEKNSTNLLKTLETYIDNQRNIGKTAEKLYIHRNTLKYRIKRIEEILECNLDEEEVVFNIKLAIKIGNFLKLN